MEKQKQAERVREFPKPRKCGFMLVAPLLAFVLPGCDIMAEKRPMAKEVNPPAQEAQKMELGSKLSVSPTVSSQTAALHAIRDMDMEKASPAVFGFLQSNATLEQKISIVDAFMFKYSQSDPDFVTGNPALDKLYHHAFVAFGTDFRGSLSDLKKNSPEKETYMRALAHGFAKCGEAGFKLAIDMASQMDLMRPTFHSRGFPDKEVSLAAPFSTMVCSELVRSNSLEIPMAVEYITEKLRDDSLSLYTHAHLVALMAKIDPASPAAPLGDPLINENAKAVLVSSIKRQISSASTPQWAKAALQKSMESVLSDKSASEFIKEMIRAGEKK